MKRVKIIYWSSTIVFVLFMLFSSIPDILMVPEAVQFITHLGYPTYFIPFIGVAKVLGCLALLVPNFNKIKEWAYAGLVFDLIGAVYSNLMVDGWNNGMLIMLPVFALAFLSYIYKDKVLVIKTNI